VPNQTVVRNRRARLYDEQVGHCTYCLEYTPFSEATLDHIIPTSKRRKDKYRNKLKEIVDEFGGNYVMACRKCNSEKSSQLLRPIFLYYRKTCGPPNDGWTLSYIDTNTLLVRKVDLSQLRKERKENAFV
jgi:hypothetical protein